jgi:plastocyanin
MRYARVAALFAALALTAAVSLPGVADAQSTTIDTGNFYFCSASFQNGVCDTTVTAGSTVTWAVSAGPHTVTQCDASFTTCPPSGGFDSGLLNTGGTYAQTFNTAGTIAYRCEFHPTQMRGSITVQSQATASPTPAPTSVPGGATAVPTSAPAAGQASGSPTPAQVPASGGEPGGGAADALILGMALVVGGALAGAAGLQALRRWR